jgi:hypothetical protein
VAWLGLGFGRVELCWGFPLFYVEFETVSLIKVSLVDVDAGEDWSG